MWRYGHIPAGFSERHTNGIQGALPRGKIFYVSACASAGVRSSIFWLLMLFGFVAVVIGGGVVVVFFFLGGGLFVNVIWRI